MVDPRNLRTSPQVGMALVGAAGPATNFLLALLAGAVWAHTRLTGDALTVVYWSIVINVSLGVFNLLPIPPLDGSRIIGGFMPRDVYAQWAALDQYGMFAVFALVIFFAGPDVEPARRRVRRGSAHHLGDRRRLPADLVDSSGRPKEACRCCARAARARRSRSRAARAASRTGRSRRSTSASRRRTTRRAWPRTAGARSQLPARTRRRAFALRQRHGTTVVEAGQSRRRRISTAPSRGPTATSS